MTNRKSVLSLRPSLYASLAAAILAIAVDGAARADCVELGGGACRSHAACSPPTNGFCTDVIRDREFHCDCVASKTAKPPIREPDRPIAPKPEPERPVPLKPE
jgi:hypothetical protein